MLASCYYGPWKQWSHVSSEGLWMEFPASALVCWHGGGREPAMRVLFLSASQINQYWKDSIRLEYLQSEQQQKDHRVWIIKEKQVEYW